MTLKRRFNLILIVNCFLFYFSYFVYVKLRGGVRVGIGINNNIYTVNSYRVKVKFKQLCVKSISFQYININTKRIPILFVNFFRIIIPPIVQHILLLVVVVFEERKKETVFIYIYIYVDIFVCCVLLFRPKIQIFFLKD